MGLLGVCRRFDGEKNAVPRYDKKTPRHRRARACPSPCGDREIGPRVTEKNAVLLRNDREGQALALREKNAVLSPNDREGQALALREKNAALSRNDREGQALALRGKTLPRYVGRGPVPRHAAVYRKLARTGPRATRKKNAVLSPNDREGQALALRKKNAALSRNDREGQALALRKKTPPRYVGRGPVPRHATIARDRPSRYGEKNAALSQNDREGQALALR